MIAAANEIVAGEWDVSRQEYHADKTCLCNSALSDFRQSVLLYYQRHVTGVLAKEPTDEMNLGTALHYATLEPEKFSDEIAVAPEGIDRRTKVGKEAWAEFEDTSAGKIILSADQAGRCKAMADAILGHKEARNAIQFMGKVEQAIRWQDPATSLWIRNLIDKWIPGASLVIDIKTSKDPSPVAFARSVFNFGYHCQAALYLRGVKQVYGVDAEFLFVVVGSQPPHEVACYCLDNDALSLGNNMNDVTLQEISQRIADSDWSSRHADRIETLALPGYAFTSG